MLKIWWLFNFHFFQAKYFKVRLGPISQVHTQTSAFHIWLLFNVSRSALVFLDFWFTSSISSYVTLATSKLGSYICISSSPLVIKKDGNKRRLLFTLFPYNCFRILPLLHDWCALFYLGLIPQFSNCSSHCPIKSCLLLRVWYSDTHMDLESLREMLAGF